MEHKEGQFDWRVENKEENYMSFKTETLEPKIHGKTFTLILYIYILVSLYISADTTILTHWRIYIHLFSKCLLNIYQTQVLC